MSQPQLQCQLDKSEISVGQEVLLICPSPLEKINPEQVQFIQSSIAEPYSFNTISAPIVFAEGKLSFKATGYKVGSHQLTGYQIKIGTEAFELAPMSLTVKSVLENPQAQITPYPSYGPAKLSSPWWWWAIWIGLLLAILGTAAKLIFDVRKEGKRAKEAELKRGPRSGEQLFLSKMRKLESAEYHRRSQYRSFCDGISKILKESVNEVLKVNALELTTSEFVKKIERSEFYRSNGPELMDILKTCDDVKFANLLITTENCLVMLDKSYRIGRKLFGGKV